MTWYYKKQPFTEALDYCAGFIYLITNKKTGRKYVGKKWFWSNRRVSQKGKTRKKIVRKESDWQNYFGSSKELLGDIAEHGEGNFDREILRLCHTKGDCSYYEAKEQFERNVLLSEDYYNNFIGAKIHGKHLTK